MPKCYVPARVRNTAGSRFHRCYRTGSQFRHADVIDWARADAAPPAANSVARGHNWIIRRVGGVLDYWRVTSDGTAAGTAPYATSDFAGRYGFRRKPEYVRFRHLAPRSTYTEMTGRADEMSGPNRIA